MELDWIPIVITHLPGIQAMVESSATLASKLNKMTGSSNDMAENSNNMAGNSNKMPGSSNYMDSPNDTESALTEKKMLEKHNEKFRRCIEELEIFQAKVQLRSVRFSSEIQERENEIRKLERDLSTRKEENKSLNGKCQRVKRMLEEKEREAEQCKREMKRIEQEKENEMRRVKRDLNKLTEENESLKRKLEEKEREAEQCKREMKRIEQEHTAQTGETNTRLAEGHESGEPETRTNYEQEIYRLTLEIIRQNKNFEREKNELKAKIEMYKKEISERVIRNQNFKEEIQRNGGLRRESQDRIENQETEYRFSAQEKRRATESSSEEEKTKKIKILEGKISTLKEEKDILEEECRATEETLQEKRSEAALLKTEKRNFELKRFDEFRQKHASTSVFTRLLLRTTKNHAGELNRLKLKIIRREEDFKKEKNALEETIKNCAGELNRLKLKVIRREEVFKKEKNELEENVEKYKKKISEITSRNENLEEEIERYGSLLREFRMKIESQETESHNSAIWSEEERVTKTNYREGSITEIRQTNTRPVEEQESRESEKVADTDPEEEKEEEQKQEGQQEEEEEEEEDEEEYQQEVEEEDDP